MNRKVWVLILVLVVAATLTAGLAMGKGKPRPPACGCPDTIPLPNGDVCTLVSCGSDCVYVCPLP